MNIDEIVRLSSHNIPKRIVNIDRSSIIFNRYLLLIVSFVVFWQLWRLPNHLLYAIPYLSYFGQGRLGILICIFLLIKYRQININLLLPGKEKYFVLLTGLVLGGAVFSFSIYALDSSFSIQAADNEVMNSLVIKEFIRDMRYYFMLLVIFNRYDNLIDLFKVFLVGVFIVMILVSFQIDSNILEVMGGAIHDQSFEAFLGKMYKRITFATMNSNTYGGLLGGFLVIGIFMLFSDRRVGIHIFYIIFSGLCVYQIIETAGRTSALKMVLSIGIFFYFARTLRKNKIIFRSLLVSACIFTFYFISTTEGFQLLTRRILDALPVIEEFTKPGLSRYRSFESLRIGAAIESMPSNIQEWLIGTGGIQTGFVPGVLYTASHVELANWLSQYGLVTFVPLMILFISLFVYFWKKNRATKNEGFINPRIELLSALGITLLVGLFFEMLNSPLFFGRWFWLGIIIAIVGVLEREWPTK